MIQISNNIAFFLTTDKMKVIKIRKHSLDEIQSLTFLVQKFLVKILKKFQTKIFMLEMINVLNFIILKIENYKNQK